MSINPGIRLSINPGILYSAPHVTSCALNCALTPALAVDPSIRYIFNSNSERRKRYNLLLSLLRKSSSKMIALQVFHPHFHLGATHPPIFNIFNVVALSHQKTFKHVSSSTRSRQRLTQDGETSKVVVCLFSLIFHSSHFGPNPRAWVRFHTSYTFHRLRSEDSRSFRGCLGTDTRVSTYSTPPSPDFWFVSAALFFTSWAFHYAVNNGRSTKFQGSIVERR